MGIVARTASLVDCAVALGLSKTASLFEVGDAAVSGLAPALLAGVWEATRRRLAGAVQFPKPRIGFDAEFNLVSAELLPEGTAIANHEVVTETDKLFACLPERITAGLDVEGLRDVVFDLGRPARAFFPRGGGKCDVVLLDKGSPVTQEEVDSVKLTFSLDNRAGHEGSLHRVSRMLDKQAKAYGFTFRVGRCVQGGSSLLADILLGGSASVLILGVPGTGKTTLIREACRVLSETANLVIVDTSNEIGGDHAVPHPSIGLSRRMMVPCPDAQAGIINQAVQNHTPDVIVVDEIGRKEEVECARGVKNRGVRVIGSGHGDLRSLIKNPATRGLVGGVEQITLGDEAAKKNHGNKLVAQRAGPPVFDVVVELLDVGKWRVTTDAASAVDSILAGGSYACEIRTRLESGEMCCEAATA